LSSAWAVLDCLADNKMLWDCVFNMSLIPNPFFRSFRYFSHLSA
jgi:hypothetical protein